MMKKHKTPTAPEKKTVDYTRLDFVRACQDNLLACAKMAVAKLNRAA